jgi:hypothetical protein
MTENEDLAQEIAAFLRERAKLQVAQTMRWVVFAQQKFQGAFPAYEPAARFAIGAFGGQPFLVRNLDAEDEHVPLVFAGAE